MRSNAFPVVVRVFIVLLNVLDAETVFGAQPPGGTVDGVICDYAFRDLYASGLTYFARSLDIFNVGRVTNFFSCAIAVPFNIHSAVVQQ